MKTLSFLAWAIHTACCVFFGAGSLCASVELYSTEAVLSAKEYHYNPYVPIELWDRLKPFFLPEDHPIKSKLDKIFAKDRVTLSRSSMIRAGFTQAKVRRLDTIVLGKSSLIKGFLLKVFLDTQPPINEWESYLQRIMGADVIRACIERHGYQHLFKVPRKWIYPLPVEPSPPDDPMYSRKNFILVVEDMDLLSPEANKELYQEKITTEMLDAFFVMIKEEGLVDSMHIDNTTFSHDGRLAFIDTEHFHKGPVRFEVLLRVLKGARRDYWKMLMQNGGPSP